MKDLSLMTWKEIGEVNKEKAIAFIVMAPIEEHGLCLPLATDLIEGDAWSKGAMEELEKNHGLDCYFLPTFPIAAASVNEFYGSIHFSMKTTYEVAYEILESIRCMGFRHIVLIASHADPDHQIAVTKAVRKVNRKNNICAIAPMGAIFMGAGLEQPKEIRSMEKEHGNDFHAGWIETSSLLSINKKHVRQGYKDLPDSNISDREMIFKKKQLKAMGKYGHIGFPRLASEELGNLLNKNCVESICEAVVNFYRREGYKKYDDYFLYKILPLHIGFIKVFGRVRRRKVGQ
ncbi:MAG: creatininase family protein [Treponema sp.]|nr:creatininase family protein [Treponema sp.]